MQICLSPGRETENLFGVALGNPKAAAHVAVRPSVLVTVKC